MAVTSNISLNKEAPAHVRCKALSQPQQASYTLPSSSRKPIQQPRSWRSDSVSLLKQQIVKQNPIPALPQYKLQTLAVHTRRIAICLLHPRETCLVKWNNLLHHHKLRLPHPAIRQSKPHRSQIFRLGQFASLSRWLQRKKEPASNVNYQSTS